MYIYILRAEHQFESMCSSVFNVIQTHNALRSIRVPGIKIGLEKNVRKVSRKRRVRAVENCEIT